MAILCLLYYLTSYRTCFFFSKIIFPMVIGRITIIFLTGDTRCGVLTKYALLWLCSKIPICKLDYSFLGISLYGTYFCICRVFDSSVFQLTDAALRITPYCSWFYRIVEEFVDVFYRVLFTVNFGWRRCKCLYPWWGLIKTMQLHIFGWILEVVSSYIQANCFENYSFLLGLLSFLVIITLDRDKTAFLISKFISYPLFSLQD